MLTSQVVFKLARAVVGSEVATEVVVVATAEELVFDLVNVGQVFGAGNIDLALKD